MSHRLLWFVLLVFVGACGTSARRNEQMKSLEDSIKTLQAQMSQLHGRVERLSHRTAMLSGRIENDRKNALSKSPPALEVFKLQPTPVAAVEEPPPEPVGPSAEIRMGADGEPVLVQPGAAKRKRTKARRRKAAVSAADSAFARALGSFQGGRTNDAYREFADFVRRYPAHPSADNALFWMAECRSERGELEGVISELSRVLREYPRSSKSADALLKIGIAHERLGRRNEAVHHFEKVVRAYPKSAVADLARARLLAKTGEVTP